MINESEAISQFLEWLTRRAAEREVEAIVGVNKSMFYSAFPLESLPRVFYVYPDLERGRLLAREAIRTIDWIYASCAGEDSRVDVETIRILIISEGKQDHFLMEGLYHEYRERVPGIEIAMLSTDAYKLGELSGEDPSVCVPIPERPRRWDHQMVRGLMRRQQMAEIRVYSVSIINYRRVYEVMRAENPHLVIITHQNAFENLEITETMAQVAEAWSIGQLEVPHFPVVLVGAGRGDLGPVVQVLDHIYRAIVRRAPELGPIERLSLSLLRRPSDSSIPRARLPLEPLSAVSVDEDLIGEIGAISESLMSEESSCEVHMCFERSEAPGALAVALGGLAGYRINFRIDHSREIYLPDFNLCGASRPSEIHEANVFFFEGNVRLIKVSSQRERVKVRVMALADAPRLRPGTAAGQPLSPVGRDLDNILGRLSDTRHEEYQCQNHVVCPVATAYRRESRGEMRVVRTQDAVVEVPSHADGATMRSYILVCGRSWSTPGSMALLLAQLLGAEVEPLSRTPIPILNIFFTKSQTCGFNEYKRVVGVITRRTPVRRADALNGFLLIGHKTDLDSWREYMEGVLGLEANTEEISNDTDLFAALHYGRRCLSCPHFPSRNPSNSCRVWVSGWMRRSPNPNVVYVFSI